MKLLFKIIVFGLLAANLLALPRFAMMEEVNCSSCHSFSGGGGARNSYGNDYAKESLVFRDVQYPWDNEDDESSIGIGLDTRYQLVSKPETELRHFPMQFALYANAEFDNLIAHTEVNRILDEFRITGGVNYSGLPLESYLSLAKALPVMGWRIDDHTIFTRGGNLSMLGLAREGMPYTPFIEAPIMAEIGSSPISGLEVSIIMGTPIINSVDSLDSPYFDAVKVNWSYSGEYFSSNLGIAVLDEGQLSQAQVFTWGLSSMGVVWLGEVSELSGWPVTEQTNFAMLHQVSYRVFQGLDLIGRYEFFDPDKDLSNGAIERISLGVEFFPIPGVELKLGYRSSQLDLPESTPDPEGQFLTQLHIYL